MLDAPHYVHATRSGRSRWAVEFEDADGRTHRTAWTCDPDEAYRWGQRIAKTGWCDEARPAPVAPGSEAGDDVERRPVARPRRGIDWLIGAIAGFLAGWS